MPDAKVGDIVICPVCAEKALFADETDNWPKPYTGFIVCKKCGQIKILGRPQQVDTLTIKVASPPKKGQQEFSFVEDELKWPGKQ